MSFQSTSLSVAAALSAPGSGAAGVSRSGSSAAIVGAAVSGAGEATVKSGTAIRTGRPGRLMSRYQSPLCDGGAAEEGAGSGRNAAARWEPRPVRRAAARIASSGGRRGNRLIARPRLPPSARPEPPGDPRRCRPPGTRRVNAAGIPATGSRR